jgi:hypothetical protein
MSDDIHIDGQNEEMDFEREDLGAKPIFTFLLSLTIGCVLVAVVLRGLYSYLDTYEGRHQPVQNPLALPTTADTRIVEQGDIKKFPQPRLETDETTEINNFRMQQEQTLNSYGWVDQSAGVARIPIDRAMALLAQRGLPTRPQAGVVPPSDVNTEKGAARGSDTSIKPATKKK